MDGYEAELAEKAAPAVYFLWVISQGAS